MKKMRKAKGFTLIELLIVIIIIGILAGMMMLSMGSATDKAQATKIISDMRNIKAACIMFYADNNSWPSEDVTFDGTTATLNGTSVKASVDQYMDRATPTGYKINHPTASAGCSISYNGDKLTSGVKEKLAAAAKESALYGSDLTTVYTAGTPYMPVTTKQ